MSLPADVVDYILSFLQSDLVSLRACSQSHPTLSRLAERHLYMSITLHDDHDNRIKANLQISALTKLLHDKPYILNYVHNLKVMLNFNSLNRHVDNYLENISDMLPTFPALRKIAFCNTGENECAWDRLPGKFCHALMECVQLKSVHEVVIGRIACFPLSSLNGSKAAKKLTLHRCDQIHYRGEAQVNLPCLPIESLTLQDCKFDVESVQSIVPWVKTCSIRELKVSNTHAGQPKIVEEFVPRLLNSCFNTLTDLYLNLDATYLSTFFLNSNSELVTHSTVIPDPSILTSLPHLNQFSIYATSVVQFRHSESGMHSLRSPVPAILRFFTISSHSLRKLMLAIDFFFIFPEGCKDCIPPPDLIWSPLIPLAAKCSSRSTTIHLLVRFAMLDSGSEDLVLYPPASLILSSLAGYQGLTPYIEKGVLTVLPRSPPVEAELRAN